MGSSDRWKPDSKPGGNPRPAGPAAADSKPAPTATGRVVHDERGNAVWDWVKDTARIAIDSTSRLLMRLEVPELQVEDTAEQEQRKESERDLGGGYDPYGGSGLTPGRTSGRRSTLGNKSTTGGARSGIPGNAGGGYDPYGKGLTNKPTRKP